MNSLLRYLVFIALLSPRQSFAQQVFPRYHQVIDAFYSTYSYSAESPAAGVEFAKKKHGWFITIVDRITERARDEQLFWSASKNIFLPLKGYDAPLGDSDAQVEKRLSAWLGSYGYERSPYYGYAGWDIDVIRDFGSRNPANMSDTLLDGMGRAYSAYASRFLWLQYGGKIETGDPLKNGLERGVMPTAKAVDSVKVYINKAIDIFSELADRYPGYQTIVGNSRFKLINEQVHGYLQMMLCNRRDLAMEFLKKIKPNTTISDIGRNHLASCDPNSILISFGDVDTYPLLYVQEMENYRRDVTVINLNLLGIPSYLDMLQRNKAVAFQVKKEEYDSPLFSYSVSSQSDKKEAVSLQKFLWDIRKQIGQKKLSGDETPPEYESESVFHAITSSRNKTSDTIRINLGSYVTADDYMLLDIVNQNLDAQSLFFTSYKPLFQDHLVKEGLIYRLVSSTGKEEDISKTEKFLNKDFRPTLSGDLSTGVNWPASMDFSLYRMYEEVIRHYLDQKDQNKVDEWMDKMEKAMGAQTSFSTNNYQIGLLYLDAGKKQRAMKIIDEYVDGLYDLYKKPSSVEMYLSKETAKSYTKYLADMLMERGMRSIKIESFLEELKD